MTTFRARRLGTTSTGGECSSEGGQVGAIGAGWMDEGTEVESSSVEAAVVLGELSLRLLI